MVQHRHDADAMTGRTEACRLALLAALALTGCGKVAQGNANAPGSPGTGNAREVTPPVVADSPAGEPTGVVGSIAHPGSPGGAAVRRTMGSGASDEAGRSTGAQMGVGTAGGLGGSSGLGMTGSFPASPASGIAGGSGSAIAPVGSSNGPPSNPVGNR